MEEFVQRLRQCRKEKGLKQQELADELGIIYRTYRRYEAGETEPDISTAVKLADFFGVSLDYLSGRSETRERMP